MSRIVTIFFPGGEEKTFSYQWRDQFDPGKDNDANYLRRVDNIKVTDRAVEVTFSIPKDGSRTIIYER